jgi:UDP-N-acetylglucosamine 2-epimerase (non-hydrolysing)
MKTLVHVVGARPNYMKVAPLMRALRANDGITQILVNTGQHYDDQLAGAVMRDLALPEPDWNLGVGSAPHAIQTARVMTAFDEVCDRVHPDLVTVVGDVNSTLAAALVASKRLVPVAHVEAGLRSHDRAMPEELNRLVTDQLSDLLLTPSADADENLQREGIGRTRIHRVGNTMVDSLRHALPAATFDRLASRLPIEAGRYAVLTLHRPSNVDDSRTLAGILSAVQTIAAQLPVVFPIHPRTRQRLADFGLCDTLAAMSVCEPLGYLDFLALIRHAKVVLTDSGGLQEETTALSIPCLTLRQNTERPITISEGTNQLVGSDPAAILAGFEASLAKTWSGRVPKLWDGHAADRIARVFTEFLSA